MLDFITAAYECHQEIIGNLVTHIGSGFAGEIEASLDILTELVTHQLQAVSQFAVFVKVTKFHLV